MYGISLSNKIYTHRCTVNDIIVCTNKQGLVPRDCLKCSQCFFLFCVHLFILIACVFLNMIDFPPHLFVLTLRLCRGWYHFMRNKIWGQQPVTDPSICHYLTLNQTCLRLGWKSDDWLQQPMCGYHKNL